MLTPEREAGLRKDALPGWMMEIDGIDLADLLAEIDRLRAALAEALHHHGKVATTTAVEDLLFDNAGLRAENEALRAAGRAAVTRWLEVDPQ